MVYIRRRVERRRRRSCLVRAWGLVGRLLRIGVWWELRRLLVLRVVVRMVLGGIFVGGSLGRRALGQRLLGIVAIAILGWDVSRARLLAVLAVLALMLLLLMLLLLLLLLVRGRRRLCL